MQITEPQFWAFLKKGGPKMFFELLPHHKHTTYTEISSGEKTGFRHPKRIKQNSVNLYFHNLFTVIYPKYFKY